MITYAQIVKAVNNKLKTQFPVIKIQDVDETEGLIRPSFRTNIDQIKHSNFMNVAKDREMTIRIYYFPSDKDKNRSEILGIQDQLEDLFLNDNTIVTDNGVIIEIYESEFDVVDKVLHFYFDIQLSENFDRSDDTDNMEILNYTEN